MLIYSAYCIYNLISHQYCYQMILGRFYYIRLFLRYLSVLLQRKFSSNLWFLRYSFALIFCKFCFSRSKRQWDRLRLLYIYQKLRDSLRRILQICFKRRYELEGLTVYIFSSFWAKFWNHNLIELMAGAFRSFFRLHSELRYFKIVPDWT